MKSNSRLWPLILASAFSALMLTSTSAGPVDKEHIGLQLYSLRNQLATNVPGTLDEIKSWGITNVELAGTYNLTPEQFKAQLVARGFNAFSGHFPYDRLRDDPEGVARDAKILGLEYVGCAWIPHDDKKPFDEKTC